MIVYEIIELSVKILDYHISTSQYLLFRLSKLIHFRNYSAFSAIIEHKSFYVTNW